MSKISKEQMAEVEREFTKQYPAQAKVVFETKEYFLLKHAATQWHAFKIGYFAAKGLLPH